MSGGSNGVMAPGRPQRTTQTYRRANTSINLTGAVADSDLFRYGELVSLVKPIRGLVVLTNQRLRRALWPPQVMFEYSGQVWVEAKPG